MSAVPTLRNVKLRVVELRRKAPQARVFGIRAPGELRGRFSLDSEEFEVFHSDSVLEISEAVSACEESQRRCVVLTSLEESELGSDLLSRLARCRLHDVDEWELLKGAFGAGKIDPLLRKHPWIARELLDIAPADGFAKVPSGFLDSDTAWAVLIRDRLGLEQARPDAADLLIWSHQRQAVERYRQASEEFRRGIRERIGAAAGAVGEALLGCVEAGCGGDALSLGLVLGVVFHEQARPQPQLRDAAVRLERFTGGQRITAADGRAWAAAAEQAFDTLIEPAASRTVVDRAEQILREILAHPFAHLSDVLAAGFEQRLEQYGAALADTLRAAPLRISAALEETARAVLTHRRKDGARVHRVEMSLRLARWLCDVEAGPDASQSFADSAQRYAADGGFTDWARASLVGGDSSATLSAALRTLAARVRVARERQNKRFAELTVHWAAINSDPAPLIVVEDVLDRVVAPLAERVPVLVVVMDGMSFAVFRELLQDLVQDDWVELQPEDGSPPQIAVAAFPTITKASRTSLLCGRLSVGTQVDEGAGFAAHPALKKTSQSSYPPRLFHKATLTDTPGSDLSGELRTELERVARRVVGVVINAVDDSLDTSDQINPHWTADFVPILSSLLSCAAQAGRAVMLTSDHGHVLERESSLRKHDDGQRYRRDGGRVEADEVLITGPRVLEFPERRLIAPWSEAVRYGMIKPGYHGGLTPQEVLAPIAVLAKPALKVQGWRPAASYIPGWWDSDALDLARPQEVARPTARDGALEVRSDLPLWDLAPQAEPAGSDLHWIGRLLKSDVFAVQQRLAGRQLPADEVIVAFLTELTRRGGKLTTAALGRALNQPPVRMGGLIAKMRQLFNVDGYDALSSDAASDSLALDRELLLKQFEVIPPT